MAVELNNIDYNTGYAQFSVDTESDLSMLPKTNVNGKGKLSAINNVCQGSMAYGTDGTDYILNGSNEWVEYIKKVEGGSGIDVLYEYESNIGTLLTGITIEDCYKYAAFIVYIKEIEAAVIIPSFTEKVLSNRITVNVSSSNVIASPISTNQITIQSTKVTLYLPNSNERTVQLYLEGSFAGAKGDKVVIDVNGSLTFTPLTSVYLWRVYGILR